MGHPCCFGCDQEVRLYGWLAWPIHPPRNYRSASIHWISPFFFYRCDKLEQKPDGIPELPIQDFHLSRIIVS
jgi:hypothetical protein